MTEAKAVDFAAKQAGVGLKHLAKAINCFNGAARAIEPYGPMHHNGMFLLFVKVASALNGVYVDIVRYLERKGV